MKNAPSPPSGKPGPIGSFATLHGESGPELAAGDTTAPIVALEANSATWWPAVGAAATTVTLGDPLTGSDIVTGSRWQASGRLRVGLGTLDLAAKSYTLEPDLRSFATSRQSELVGLAWFTDASRVALLVGPPRPRVDRPPPTGYDPDKRELVIATLSGGVPPVRRPVTVPGTPMVAAGDDRVLVAANQTILFDAAGSTIAGPDALPGYVVRASFGAGMFALVGDGGKVILVDPHAGATLATWALDGVSDAVAIPHGVVAVDLGGNVHVGCLSAGAIKPIAEVRVDRIATHVQVLGDRLVVSAGGPEPIRVATFTNPCE
jgi:hypothetical protein